MPNFKTESMKDLKIIIGIIKENWEEDKTGTITDALAAIGIGVFCYVLIVLTTI